MTEKASVQTDRLKSRHVRTVWFLLAFLAVGEASLPGAADAQQLAVLSRRDDVMAFYDVKTGTEVARLPLGRFCHEIASDSARHRILAATYDDNKVHVVDSRSREITTFEIDGYSRFHGTAVSRSGDIIWVTAEDSAAILELDPNTGSLLRVWPTFGERSHMIVATRDGRLLFVANMDSGTLSIIDRVAGTTQVVATGPESEGVGLAPDESELWVASRRDKAIYIVDPQSGEVMASVSNGSERPVKLEISPDGRQVWISNHLAHSVNVFDRANRTMIATIETGERPLSMAFNDDGSRVYLSRPPENEVLEIDTATFEILRHIPTANNPDGVLWIP